MITTDVICKIIESEINEVGRTVNLSDKILDDLCISSLKMMVILSEIEKQTSTVVPYSKLNEVKTVEDLLLILNEQGNHDE